MRDLEAWLFGEVVRHLWWRVLLPDVAAPEGKRLGSATPAPAAQDGSLSGEGGGCASLQGTPRSYETPEVGCACTRGVGGGGCVCGAGQLAPGPWPWESLVGEPDWKPGQAGP